MEELLKPWYWTKRKSPEAKEKLPAVGTAQYFTILRIGNNNVKEELMWRFQRS
jgi:hypothetical protein